jgi:bacillopeptidase F (M6 metalloprotease family)
MTNNYLDRSNYLKGLLLMIGKDKIITDKERDFLHKTGKTLSFNKEFIERAIDELFENEYLGNDPPVFSQKQYAEAFLRDAIKLACVDNDLSIEEFD